MNPELSEDEVLAAWLAFIKHQMEAHPELIQPLSAESLTRAEALIGDMEVDLDEDLGDEFWFDWSVE